MSPWPIFVYSSHEFQQLYHVIGVIGTAQRVSRCDLTFKTIELNASLEYQRGPDADPARVWIYVDRQSPEDRQLPGEDPDIQNGYCYA